MNVRAVENSSGRSTMGVVATREYASNPNTHAFRLNYLATNNNLEAAQTKNASNNTDNDSMEDHCPILEYTCGDAVRPVPMVRTRVRVFVRERVVKIPISKRC